MKSVQSDALVLEGHAPDQGAVGEERNVHGGEGKQSVHDIWRRGANLEETGQNYQCVFFTK